jgi:hypothetical protein
MSLTLPPVGTSRLLELLSPYAPDDFIAEVCPRGFTGGRRHALSAAQLWRTHLLAVLTSTHSLNLLVAQLPEQVVWRRFARLRHTLPTARMLSRSFGRRWAWAWAGCAPSINVWWGGCCGGRACNRTRWR